MSSIWDWFRPLRVLIHWLDGGPRTTPQRHGARLQLELLENREVPSADVFLQSLNLPQTVQQALPAANNSLQSPNLSQTSQQALPAANNSLQPTNLSQIYQLMLQAANNAAANQALPLENMLTTVVSQLPAISSWLNVAASNVTRYAGPQGVQPYNQVSLWAVDFVLINLENATEFALQDAGMFPNPTFNMDVSFINAFMSDPLNYTPPI